MPLQNLLQLVRKPARMCSGTRTVFLLQGYTRALTLACWPRSGLVIVTMTTIACATEQQPHAQEGCDTSHHGPDMPAPLVQSTSPGGKKKAPKSENPKALNCQFVDTRIYFTGVLHPWSRGCCWTVSMMLKFSLLPSWFPCRAWIHARVWNFTLQRNPPWRAASCSAAMQLGSTDISWDWEHKVEENLWNACGVSLFLLRATGIRWKCEAMVGLTHWLFGTVGNHQLLASGMTRE